MAMQNNPRVVLLSVKETMNTKTVPGIIAFKTTNAASVQQCTNHIYVNV